MITYEQPKKSVIMKVLRNGNVVGSIHQCEEGFYYRPTGGPCWSTYKTLEQVKETIK